MAPLVVAWPASFPSPRVVLAPVDRYGALVCRLRSLVLMATRRGGPLMLGRPLVCATCCQEIPPTLPVFLRPCGHHQCWTCLEQRWPTTDEVARCQICIRQELPGLKPD